MTSAPAPAAVLRSRTLPPVAAFAGAALTFAALYLAAGALTPLLVVFQQEWGFAPWVLTIAFAAYAIGLHSGLLNGATAFVLPESAAVAGFFLGRVAPRRTTVIGGVSVLTGTALIAGGVAAKILPLLWLG